jgi:hypothetical protein
MSMETQPLTDLAAGEAGLFVMQAEPEPTPAVGGSTSLDGNLTSENLDTVTEAMAETSRSSGRFSRSHEHHIIASYIGKLRLQSKLAKPRAPR